MFWKKKTYKPVCPFGHKDCIFDPAYIKFTSPKIYRQTYGLISPIKLLKNEKWGCMFNFYIRTTDSCLSYKRRNSDVFDKNID